jgi:two-component system response regulator HydG
MTTATVHVVSADPAFTDTVRGLIGAIGQLDLQAHLGFSEIGDQLRGEGTALVLLHVSGESDTEPAVALLRQVATLPRPVATVVVSDSYRATQALTLLRLGAADYITRPLDLNRLTYLLDILTVRFRYAPAPAPLSKPLARLGEEDSFLYYPTSSMGQLMEQVKQVAPLDVTVLLGGETGTGKNCLARLIHELSPRRHLPFLVVDSGAVTENLIASELFGHVKGAFTGADQDRTGKLADVGAGTLLLDEIDSLPLPLQGKLLRVVEERVFAPLGANRLRPMEARLIVASNRQLDQEVAAGRFRTDLYYRLNVMGLYLPPLRERQGLLAPLADKFIQAFAARNDRPVAGIAADAMQALEAYSWPGNIRELRNLIERAMTLCIDAEIRLEHLPPALQLVAPGKAPAAARPPASLAQTKEQAEAQQIAQTLRRHKNNRLRAAAELGISRVTLYKKLHRYGLMAAT